MTGRTAGYCAGFGLPGYANPVPGRGFGRGRGFGGGGRGRRNMFYATGLPGWMRYGAAAPLPYATPDPEIEKQALRHHAEALESELNSIKKRLSEIEAATAADPRE